MFFLLPWYCNKPKNCDYSAHTYTEQSTSDNVCNSSQNMKELLYREVRVVLPTLSII